MATPEIFQALGNQQILKEALKLCATGREGRDKRK